jgi:hypothetical protein
MLFSFKRESRRIVQYRLSTMASHALGKGLLSHD